MQVWFKIRDILVKWDTGTCLEDQSTRITDGVLGAATLLCFDEKCSITGVTPFQRTLVPAEKIEELTAPSPATLLGLKLDALLLAAKRMPSEQKRVVERALSVLFLRPQPMNAGPGSLHQQKAPLDSIALERLRQASA